MDGYNFAPLFKYLLKQVGKKWFDVWEDVYPRVDGMSEPIETMVVNINSNGYYTELDDITDINPHFSWGKYDNNSEWSTLYVDNNGILQFVDKDYIPYVHYGDSWGQSFNGHPITKITAKYYAKFEKFKHYIFLNGRLVDNDQLENK